MKQCNIIGELCINGIYKILEDTSRNKFYLESESGEIKEFTWEEYIVYISRPWTKVDYYSDELGHHYKSVVYDCVYIDIWGETIESLLNILCRLMRNKI